MAFDTRSVGAQTVKSKILIAQLQQSFAKRDLPESHRVIPPGAIVTKDYRPDRLNVHVRDDGTVSHVTHG